MADHIGKWVGEVIPQLRGQVLPLYQEVLATGCPVAGREVRGVLPSDPGREHLWLVSHHPVSGSDGRITGIITVVEDVTALEQTRRELSAAHDRLTEAQRVAGVGSWEWNILEDRVWWSDQLFRLLGRSPAVFRPSYDAWFDVVHPEDRAQVRAQIEATLERNEPYSIECRVLHEDGSVRRMRATASLLRTSDGIPERLVGTASLVP